MCVWELCETRTVVTLCKTVDEEPSLCICVDLCSEADSSFSVTESVLYFTVHGFATRYLRIWTLYSS